MIVEVMGQILVLSTVTLFGLFVHRFLRLELTLSCLLVGFIAGFIVVGAGFDTGIRAYNFEDLVFFIFLPLLIFEAAWGLKPSLLKRWLIPILLLSTVGVIITCLIIACFVFLGVGHVTGFPWIAAILTGAILASTDPVSVTTQLRMLKAPEDLTTLVEGESLFNDATGIVLFTIVISFATQPIVSDTSYFTFFAFVFLGGIAFGLVAGLVISLCVLLLREPIASHFVLVFGAFLSFYIADEVLDVSGIMSVMIAALVAKASLQEVEDEVMPGVHLTFQWLGLFLNSLLFVIMGLVVTVSMFAERWLAMLIAIAASLLARAVSVFICGLLVRKQVYFIPKGWQIILTWGGLRGAIAIALVLSLPTSLPYWWTIQSMVFGVVIFSLLCQSTTNKPVLKKHGKPFEDYLKS